MEAIGLTDEQRSKLEELCIQYFPEYNGMITVDRVAVLFNGKNPIHWFELSLVHLPPRVLGNSKGNFSGILQRPMWAEKIAEVFAKVHPVDFLYEHYQEEVKADAEINVLKSQ